jgi:hypothetical protein
MRRILLFFIILASFSAQARHSSASLPHHPDSFSQHDTVRKNKQPAFYLQYKCSLAGLSIINPSMPVLIVKGSRFRYTYQRSRYFSGNGRRIERISHGVLRQSSIDSILNLISLLKDTSINRINPFVMSGSIYYVTVANGTDTTRFKMINTFDYTALKIVNILNQYLPSDNKLWASEELIKQEKESREWFNIAGEEEKKKKDSIKAISN